MTLPSEPRLTIGKLAKRAGVGVDTVRYYERMRLLPAARRTASGYRIYGREDGERLSFIRRAKALGFSLDEVGDLLALNDGGGKRERVRALAERRLAEIEQKISELTAIRDTLGHLVHDCHGNGPLTGCSIIQAASGSGG